MSEPHGEVRHEPRDVDPRALGRLGLLLVAVTVGAMLILVPFFRVLESASDARDPDPGPMAFEGPRQPPGPQLQERPTRDVEEQRAEEEVILGSYGWVDREEGVVRLPIERAIELIAERGLPEWEANEAPGGEEP